MAIARDGMRPWPYHLVYVAHALPDHGLVETAIRRASARAFRHEAGGNCPSGQGHGGPSYSFTVHGMGEADNAPRLAFDTKIRAAKCAVAISAYTRSQLMRHVDPALWSKIKVVHCGLPETAFSAPGAEAMGPETPVFLCIGRLSGEKGHLVLLVAFAHGIQRRGWCLPGMEICGA